MAKKKAASKKRKTKAQLAEERAEKILAHIAPEIKGIGLGRKARIEAKIREIVASL